MKPLLTIPLLAVSLLAGCALAPVHAAAPSPAPEIEWNICGDDVLIHNEDGTVDCVPDFNDPDVNGHFPTCPWYGSSPCIDFI